MSRELADVSGGVVTISTRPTAISQKNLSRRSNYLEAVRLCVCRY